MRAFGGVVSMLVALVALAPCGCGGAAPRAPAPSRAEAAALARAGVPAWVPELSPAQRALLVPPEAPIGVPARRTFPDLDRFGYAKDHRMVDPQEAVKLARMVVSILVESPRHYVLGEAPAAAENIVSQYGPAPALEPDGFQTVQRGAQGVGRLVPVKLSDEARARFDDGAARAARGDLPGAAEAYRAAVRESPKVPALHVAVGETMAQAGDAAGARAAFETALAIDATLASAHLGLAELADRAGDPTMARGSLAEALAYHPPSPRAAALASKLTGRHAEQGRLRPFPIFLDVDEAGAVHAATEDAVAPQMYAGCRAILRFEPDVRARIFDESPRVPYYVGMVEEIVCHEAALGAYLTDRVQQGPAAADDRVERLLVLAHDEGLAGFVMFEILGRHRPERARGAPPDVHRAMVSYVERHVLGEGEPPPTGVYTVSR